MEHVNIVSNFDVYSAELEYGFEGRLTEEIIQATSRLQQLGINSDNELNLVTDHFRNVLY